MPYALRLADRTLTLSTDHPVVCFAGDELARYRSAAGAAPLRAVRHAADLRADDPAVLSADSPFDLLLAVYRCLEADGWRWYHPGPSGEARVAGPPPGVGVGAAPAAHRRLVVDVCADRRHPLWRGEALALVDWLPKAGFTGLVLAGPEPDEADRAAVAEALARRGLALEWLPSLDAALHSGHRAGRTLLSLDRPWLAEGLGEPGPRLSELATAPGGLEVVIPGTHLGWLGNLGAPLVNVVCADLRAVAAGGVESLLLPVHGAASWWAAPLTLYACSRAALDPTCEPTAIRSDWCAGRYGAVADAAQRAWRRFEQVTAPLWGLRSTRRHTAGEAADLLTTACAARDSLRPLRALFEQALAASADPRVRARLALDLRRFDLHCAHLELWALRTEWRLGHPSLALRAAGQEAVAAAWSALDGLPPGLGAALDHEYRETLTGLSQWCGGAA